MHNINNSVVERGYKRTSKSETIRINDIHRPFKVINGSLVYAKGHDGNDWVW